MLTLNNVRDPNTNDLLAIYGLWDAKEGPGVGRVNLCPTTEILQGAVISNMGKTPSKFCT